MVIAGDRRCAPQGSNRGRLAAPWLSRVLACGLVVVSAALVCSGPARAADSLSVRWQVGAASDVTNEQYFQDAFVDTTFLGRQLYGNPELRSAAVASVEIGGRRGNHPWTYQIRPDLTVGDKVLRGAAAGTIRSDPSTGWDWRVDPAVEVQRDISFGTERKELRSSIAGRSRKRFGEDEDRSFELRGGADLFRAIRTPGSYSLSHDGVRLGAAYEHVPLLGWEYRVEEASHVRTFPDSVSRNHFEHQVMTSLRRDFGGGHSFVAESDLQWRRTLSPQTSSRDRFVEFQPSFELTLRAGASNSFRLAVEDESTRYAKPDSSVDFDYDIARARAGIRREAWDSWAFSAGARLEVLRSGWNPIERYREWAALLEAERFSVSSWWVIAPAVAWRTYQAQSAGTGFDAQPVHSSYVGYELLAMVDQAIPARLRLRLTGNGRIERHRDSSQDSRSLYLSFDVRRLF